MRAPADTKLGILNSGATNGGALLMNYNFSRGFSLAFRPEYIASNGNAAAGLNLLGYGAGSSAFSFTVTPAYQKSGFFLRGDFGIVDARSFVKCDAFGVLGNNGTQARGVAEPGSMF